MFEREDFHAHGVSLRITDIFFMLCPEDNVVVLLKSGEFFGIMGATQDELNSNFDLIQGEIAKVLKRRECREGYWIFKLKHNWSILDGHELPILEDTDFNDMEEEDE